MSDQDLREKEDAAVLDDTAKDFSPAEQGEFDKLGDNDDQVGSGYTGRDKKKKQFWSSRRKKGGLAGVVVTSSVIAAWSFFAPGFLVNHLRNLLLGNDLQISHSRRYRRKHFSKMSDAFSADGRRGGKIISEMERKGYKFSFGDPTDRKKITGITLPGRRVSIPNLSTGALADHMEEFINVYHPLRTSRWKTKRMEAFYQRYKVSRKSVTTRIGAEADDPRRAVNKGVADQTVGEEPDKSVTGRDEGADGETDEEAAARGERNASNEAIGTGDGSLEGIKQKLRDGVPVAELSDEERKILQVASRVDQEVIDLIEDINVKSLTGQAFGSIKAIGSSTDVLDKVCIAKNRIRAISFAARNYRALSLLRYASVFIKAGDAVRTGKTDAKLLNELMKRTTAVDANGIAIGGSPGFAYLIKNKFSKSRNDLSKSNVSVDGSLTGVPGALQQATDTIPGVSAGQCGVYQNPAFQIGFAVVEIGVAIFSGGSSKAVSESAKQVVVRSIKESLERILTRQTAKALLRTVAIEITFEGALTLLQVYSEKAQSLNFTGQERGGELGSILGAGSGALTKQRGLKAGMVPATSTQYAVANEQYIAERRQEQKNRSFFARVLDYENTDSLTYQTASQLATTPVNVAGIGLGFRNSVNKAASLLSNPVSLLGIFSSRATAQSGDEVSFDEYDVKGVKLATDPAGNLLPVMRQDILDIDPIENIQYLSASGDIDPTSNEPIENFAEHVKNCVDTVDILSTIENKDQNNPQYDCLATQGITVRYKAHLAWLDMVDGVDGYLFPEEITAGAAAPSPSVTDSTPVVGDTANVACVAGTTDAGEAEGWSDGKKYRIRLCEIPGFVSTSDEDPNNLVRVNSTASGKWLQLFKQAQSAGTTLVGNSSFRTNAKQQSLYGCYKSGNCNSGREAARPGYSNHQIGFAIDINIAPGPDPSLTTCKASPGTYPVYQLLAANAPGLGINATVLSECWHWSASGG